MVENKNLNFDKELTNVQNVPSLLRKFTMIWTVDNIVELQKQCDLMAHPKSVCLLFIIQLIIKKSRHTDLG